MKQIHVKSIDLRIEKIKIDETKNLLYEKNQLNG